MKGVLTAAVLLVAAGTASADSFAGVTLSPAAPPPHKLSARTVSVDSRTGAALPVVTRVHPVVGSVERKSHFANPLTHKARHTDAVYNPVLGQFGTRHFRR
ncbi:MAG: hypothetical protein ACKODX_19170 [Gemmata sp.]